VLLREHLAESLWYLHSQPPGFNLGVGLVLKAFPESYYAPFSLAYAAMGLALTLSLYLLLVRVGLSSLPSAVVAGVFAASPAAVLYENLLFYDYPVAFLLTGAALALTFYVSRPTFVRGLAFFALLGALVYTRSLYHLVWLLAVIALVTYLRGVDRRRVLLASLVPLLLVVGLYAKNLVLFGVPATSSWTGMNLVQTTVGALSPEETIELIESGRLSRFAAIGIFEPLERYGDLIEPEEPTGVPVLDERRKALGHINANNPGYIQVSDGLLEDDLWVIRNRPGTFLHGIVRAHRSFFSTPTKLDFLYENRTKVAAYERAWSTFVYGTTRLGNGVGLVILAAYALALGFGAVSTFRTLRARAWSPAAVVVAFCFLTIAYTMVVANISETTESYRYRWVLDPLALAILASPLARGTFSRIVGTLGPRRPAVRAGQS
jgi:hypothetical protein